MKKFLIAVLCCVLFACSLAVCGCSSNDNKKPSTNGQEDSGWTEIY